jgi:hypothetical protein
MRLIPAVILLLAHGFHTDAPFPAITLSNPGDKIVRSGSAEMFGITSAASVSRFGLSALNGGTTTDLNADKIQLTNVAVTFMPASVTPPPATTAFAITEFGLGPQLEPVGGGPTLRWKASYWNRNGTHGYSMRTERYRILRWGSNPLAPVQVDLSDCLTDPAGSQSVTASQPQVVSDLLKLLP